MARSDGDGAYIGLDMDSALCRPLRCCDKKQRDDGADCAAGRGVSLEAINGDHATLDWSRQLYAALTAKGGERK